MPSVPPPSFRRAVERLVRQFESNREYFLSSKYSEAQARLDFIDPLFEALGWQVALRPGENPREREVVVERGQTTGRPDYNFRLSGQTKFFAEAKAPHIPIARSDVVLQAKKYAWNTTDELVYFAVVTDFEEFRLYDAPRKPNPKRPEAGLIFAYRYSDYLDPKALADLWLLSREAVQGGSLDRLLKPAVRLARQKTPLDKQFLSDLTGWREQLAKAVFKTHPELTVADLNSAVQVFLDRLIFIRIAEDRGILPPHRLREIARIWREEGRHRPIVADLLPLFRDVNADLNGEIFKPHLCERIQWDSALVAEIIEDGLEPYSFAQIGVELLGSIYERYLGKTIRVTATRAVVEDKPEVRKAGGVYYTPRYIVDYIVANTVGKLIEGKTPAQIAKLRIVDPACGSGSFLLGAYQCLLDYHRQWYTENGALRRRRVAAAKAGQIEMFTAEEAGEIKLSLEEKARILKNSIFGVDLDPQAVEITMMSLYVKLLEGERGLSGKNGLLPLLGSNIKCGNSLIGPEVYQQQGMFDEADRIRPFDWESEREGFGAVMKFGGFDAVIGNPPYVQLSMMDYYDEVANGYFSQAYSSSMGRLNTFGLFIERAARGILRNKGYLSYIVPNTLLTQEYYQDLRRMMLRNDLVSLTTYKYPVFADAVVETTVFVLRKSTTPKNKVQIVHCDNSNLRYDSRLMPQELYESTHANAFLINVDRRALALRTKLEKGRRRLADVAHVNQAIALKHDRSKSLFRQKKAANFKKVLDGRNIQRYSLEWPGLYLAYDVRNIHSCKRTDIFEADEKIFFRRVGDRLIATYDNEQYYALNTLVVITPKDLRGASLKYLLALLNSHLLNYYYVTYLKSTKKVFSEIQARQLAQIPIHLPAPFESTDKIRHDELVRLADLMLALNQRRSAVSGSAALTRLESEINATDERIDNLVYELYGLTEAEIRVVKGKPE